MIIVLLPATDAAEATLQGLQAAAMEAFSQTPCAEVEPGGVIVPAVHTPRRWSRVGSSDRLSQGPPPPPSVS